MNCQKCNGLMVNEWMADELDDDVYAWRCINCGAFVDATIDRNRKPRRVDAALADGAATPV